MKFKIIMGVLLMALTIILFSGCSATIHNPLADEESYIYQSEDERVRMEVTTLGYGKLTVETDMYTYVFIVVYQVAKDQVNAYIDISKALEDQFIFDVSFELNDSSKINYDVMNLTDTHHKEDEVLSDLDITLYRVYDEEVKPYNYMFSKFESEEHNIVLYNNDLTSYSSNALRGTMDGVDIYMFFMNTWFNIVNFETGETIVSGLIIFDGMNLILTPDSMYTEFPNEITLIYSKYIS